MGASGGGLQQRACISQLTSRQSRSWSPSRRHWQQGAGWGRVEAWQEQCTASLGARWVCRCSSTRRSQRWMPLGQVGGRGEGRAEWGEGSGTAKKASAAHWSSGHGGGRGDGRTALGVAIASSIPAAGPNQRLCGVLVELFWRAAAACQGPGSAPPRLPAVAQAWLVPKFHCRVNSSSPQPRPRPSCASSMPPPALRPVTA